MVEALRVGGEGFKKRRMCDVFVWEKEREREGRKSEVDRVWRMKAKWGKKKRREIKKFHSEKQRDKEVRVWENNE